MVVGAGAAGSWAAKELCEAGQEVLLLEAGRELGRRSFPCPPPPRLLFARGFGACSLASPSRSVAPRTRAAAPASSCATATTRTRRRRGSLNWFPAGGSRAAACVGAGGARLSPRELAGWPLAYEDLAPFSDRVERFLGREQVALTPGEERFRAAVEEAFPERRVLPAPLVRHDEHRVPAPLRAALATGRLTLRSGAVARSVLVAEAARDAPAASPRGRRLAASPPGAWARGGAVREHDRDSAHPAPPRRALATPPGGSGAA